MIVFIDDEVDLCEIFNLEIQFLELEGKSFSIAEEAIEFISANKESIDLILCDYRMKGITGFELFKKLPELNCPFCIITGELDLKAPDELNGKITIHEKPFDYLKIPSLIKK